MQPPGLQAHDVQQVVDLMQQPLGILAHDSQALCGPFGQLGRARQQFLNRRQNHRQRGAQLVTDVGDKQVLQAVQFGQLAVLRAEIVTDDKLPDPSAFVIEHSG